MPQNNLSKIATPTLANLNVSNPVAPASEKIDRSNVKLIVPTIVASPDSRPATISISLTQAPPVKVNWYENVPVLIAGIGLFGVILTVGLGYWRMRKELGQALTLANNAREDSRKQADEDRELSREQAHKERQHSAAEAHRERIATSRRIVYLDAAKNTFAPYLLMRLCMRLAFSFTLSGCHRIIIKK